MFFRLIFYIESVTFVAVFLHLNLYAYGNNNMFMLRRVEKAAKLKEKKSIRDMQKDKLQTVSANICIACPFYWCLYDGPLISIVLEDQRKMHLAIPNRTSNSRVYNHMSKTFVMNIIF